MRERIANTGDPAQDWVDRGPCAPIPCGPTGERHTNITRSHILEREDRETEARGHTFAQKGHRPMQFAEHVAIESVYGD